MLVDSSQEPLHYIGPSQWKDGVPDTPVGRVTEHVRVTVSPMRTGKDGEELITMNAGSAGMQIVSNCL